MRLSSGTRRNRRNNSLVGLHVQSDGIALAHMATDKQGIPMFKHLAYAPLADRTQLAQLVLQYARQLELKRLPWTLVLENESYQLLLLDLPDLAEEDIEDALKLRVNDLISYPIDEARVDVFRLPESAYRGRMKMAYVTSCQEKPLLEMENMLGESGIFLSSIDIADQALRNLVTLSCQDVNTGILYLRQYNSVINLCHHEHLVLNRRVENGWSTLADTQNVDTFQIQVDALVLEIQRSFDYFESQLGLGSIGTLKIASDHPLSAEIEERLDASFNTRVSILRPQEHFSFNQPVDNATTYRCTLAMGAALRAVERPGEEALA